MKGLIFDIKRYAVHDGPGIRTTIFLKGCPLKCWWCHNPESQSTKPEIYTKIEKIGSTEFKKEETIGRYYTTEEIKSILEKESIFMEESGGGVTFSGGEPFMQTEFLLDLLKLSKEMGLHTAIDTTGFTTIENLNKVIPYTNLFLYDIKHLDDTIHKEYTGVGNLQILNNLKHVLHSGKEVILRIPIIPGVNDSIDHLKELSALIEGLKAPNLKEINILPYHKIGASKYDRFHLKFNKNKFDEPNKESLNYIVEQFEKSNLKVKIGG